MSARALAPKTVECYRSSLSTLWTWLEEEGITDLNNPWSKHRSIRPTVRTKRRPLSDEQLASLLIARYDTATYGQMLADLLRLALVTGCRLEELCVLRMADVLKHKDGYWLTITEGKTAAGTFTAMMEGAGVPVHTIQLLIGHSRKQTMCTTAIYTRGERVDLRKVINKLRYSPQVMRLVARAPQRH